MAKRFFTPIDLTGTISTSSAPERAIKWNDGEGTLEVGLKGGNIKLPVGQEEVSLCYNGTGETLTKGTVVYISGAQGQRPRISKASASSETTSSKTFGVVSENIANGAEGFVTTFGAVSNINTSSFTEGSALWLSTTAGEITQTAPSPPNHSVFVGYCLKTNQNAGRIFVKVQNGYELEELHNVSITSLQDKDILQYNSSTQLWENSPAPKTIVASGSSYPNTELSNGQLFYNTSNGRMAVYFNSVWKEFDYAPPVSELFIIEGGNSSETQYLSILDGGNASTSVFIGNVDGGISI